MSKYKIIALFGEAGSGKDYIQKKIMETDFGKKNLSKIISCTTRPPREGEENGKDYYFLKSSDTFFDGNHLKKWIEFSCFRNWWYGTSINNLQKDKINIGIFNINGIKQILERNDIECLPIYIKVFPKLRLMRQLQREYQPDCDEIIRRYLADQKDFLNVPFHCHIVENNYNEIEMVIKEIMLLSYDFFNMGK